MYNDHTSVTEIHCGLEIKCDTCSANDISFNDGSTSRNPGSNADGCSTLTVVCPADGDATVILQLDKQDVTTVSGGEATAQIVCDKGVWQFNGNAVTTVNCMVNPCTTCLATDVILTPGDLVATATTPTAGEDDCVSMTVTCDASGTTGATTTMTVCCLVLKI